MPIKLKPLSEQVIVITGASSGIGHETAIRAAAKGAKVVLVSRSEDVLDKVEQDIKDKGGEAIHVVADVAVREQMEKVAETAIEKYGRIDTWVNDAGVGIFGRLEEISDEDHRRLFETNFWGVVNGSLIAAKYLKQFGGGAIINLGSVASDVGFPLQAMYAASKHAIKGFTDGLRDELEAEKATISVTLIKPAAIGTPFGNKAKSYLAQEAQLPPPLYDASEVALAILYACSHRMRDIYVGGGSRVLSAISKVAPRLVDIISEKQLMKMSAKDKPAQPRHDNLYQSVSDGRSRGSDLVCIPMRSLYTRAVINPYTSLGVLATGVGAVILLGKLMYGKLKKC